MVGWHIQEGYKSWFSFTHSLSNIKSNKLTEIQTGDIGKSDQVVNS